MLYGEAPPASGDGDGYSEDGEESDPIASVSGIFHKLWAYRYGINMLPEKVLISKAFKLGCILLRGLHLKSMRFIRVKDQLN